MGKAPCYGDSGGPAFVNMPDGTWRVFGIDSAGVAQSCDAGDYMALMSDAVPWIEEQSHIDVTPCHDADGTWNPSAACRNFSMTPHLPGRTWTSGCAEPALSPPLASCGPAYVPGDGGVEEDASADAHPGFAHLDAAEPAPGDDLSAFRPRTHGQACAFDGLGSAPWPWLALGAALLRRRRN
jgi:MYXO-CTERM domain-containing protein